MIVLQNNKASDMKRKRAPGGGRKPKDGPTTSLTIRIPDDLRSQLESEAAANKRSVARTLLWHARQSLDRERAKDRDPALRGLLVFIARLAESLSGGTMVLGAFKAKSFDRSKLPVWMLWRTNLFKFRAFKIAVAKILDALEEPPDEGLDQITKGELKFLEERFPAFAKAQIDAHKSPEALGAYEFEQLWDLAHRTSPLSEKELEIIRGLGDMGKVYELEFYELPKALKALELKPKTAKQRTKSDD